MIRARYVDRYTGMTIHPKPPQTPKQIRQAKRQEDDAYDKQAQAHVEGRA